MHEPLETTTVSVLRSNDQESVDQHVQNWEGRLHRMYSHNHVMSGRVGAPWHGPA